MIKENKDGKDPQYNYMGRSLSNWPHSHKSKGRRKSKENLKKGRDHHPDDDHQCLEKKMIKIYKINPKIFIGTCLLVKVVKQIIGSQLFSTTLACFYLFNPSIMWV